MFNEGREGIKIGFTALGPGLGCTKIKLGTGICYHPPFPLTTLFYNGKCNSIIEGSQGNIQIHDNLTSKASPNVSRTIDTRTYSRLIYDSLFSPSALRSSNLFLERSVKQHGHQFSRLETRKSQLASHGTRLETRFSKFWRTKLRRFEWSCTLVLVPSSSFSKRVYLPNFLTMNGCFERM